MLIVTGDDAERIHSETALAMLCGVAPIPASSGTKQRYRVNYGGHPAGQRRDLPHRDCPNALPPANDRLRRKTNCRGEIQTRDHSLFEEIRGSGILPAADDKRCPATSGCGKLIGRWKFELDKYRSINALAESFVDTFKTELIHDRVWRTRSQMELAIIEWVGWFNSVRIHQNIDDFSPEEFERRYAEKQALVG